MRVDVVADVGNSRIKWGLCGAGGGRRVAGGGQDPSTLLPSPSIQAISDHVSLPADDPESWSRQLERWQLGPGSAWVVGGVQPRRRDTLRDWLAERGFPVRLLHAPAQVPVQVELEHPEQVGIDRLLNAVAVNQRRQPDQAAIVVDAGTAVTVDYVDANGAFRGGAIFPGLRLMAQALHEHTALLPLVDVRRVLAGPGKSTQQALEVGLLHAVAGGIASLIQAYQAAADARVQVFLGGGDAELLAPALHLAAVVWPTMTLEGMRLAAATWTDKKDEG